MSCRGKITSFEEFVYPDDELSELPKEIRIVMPKNGKPGISLLYKTDAREVRISLEGEGFCAEYYHMRAIPVEYNTGDGENQGGAMVLTDRPAEKPAYATRLAPFHVYDCLEERADGLIETDDGKVAVYICLKADDGIEVGEHTIHLRVIPATQKDANVNNEGTASKHDNSYNCLLRVQVYPVSIPDNGFHVTNWFSSEAICRFHQVEEGTDAYLEMLGRYARVMRRMHQDTFFIQFDEKCVKSKDPYAFDFEHLTPAINVFFEEGMRFMELGVLLDRGFLPDGKPDMYTEHFTCAMAKEVPVDGGKGYAVTVRFVQALAAYLKKHGWEDRVLFHIHDEPDIHFKTPEVLEGRKRQYFMAASVLRKYIPGIRIIEAVDTAEFRGGIDIWVPGTAGYEKRKDEFDALIALGEEVWTYVCCGPEGEWLNRFLDFALLKGRLLFWGCARNRISGFLHWGLNQFQMGMNPYEATSCPNHTGIGTNFPCGDSFIVYPGEEGPCISMRLEAARRGAEDAALFALLRKKDAALHDRIIEKVFTDNHTYQDDPRIFQEVYEELLRSL